MDTNYTREDVKRLCFDIRNLPAIIDPDTGEVMWDYVTDGIPTTQDIQRVQWLRFAIAFKDRLNHIDSTYVTPDFTEKCIQTMNFWLAVCRD